MQDIHTEQCRTRDFFPAFAAGVSLNSMRKDSADKVWDVEEILSLRYPKRKDVTVTHDPDRGAMWDWQDAKLRGH